MEKRYFLQSFGCQMNDYDVARMRELLRRSGYTPAVDAERADVIVIDTCAIREKAESKTASTAGRYKDLKDKRPDLVLAIAGCVAQQEGQKLLKRLPYVDLVFGPDHIPRLIDMIDEVRLERRRYARTDVIDVEEYEFLDADPLPSETRITALVTVQKGCDNECAYCVVPNTRGREVSRPAHEVVAEVERFVRAGAREVTLIGQNVNAYHGLHGHRDDFAELLAMVDRVPGLVRLRYTTSHPMDFTPGVADAFRDLRRLCAWLHLPVQSGSSRTLERMRRGYTREQYLEKIAYLRKVAPRISLTTDVIVGYPGETDEDHKLTLSLLEEVQYDSIYSFAYSPRPNTSAVALGDDVPDDVKSARLQEVQLLQRGITARDLANRVGQIEEILVEGQSRGSHDRGEAPQLCGRTQGNHMVNVPLSTTSTPLTMTTDVDAVRGTVQRVRITEARAHTLLGTLVAAA
jgi:tRNA-2-methylthio-N6-dimethylallyladenosine synthase